MDWITQCLNFITYLIQIVLHLDTHLNYLIAQFGPWIYVLMFLIIYCETGFVVTPFLPGDSLLFALGALTSSENAVLIFPLLCVLLTLASILGDNTNYFIGRRIGPKVFNSDTSRWLNKAHLKRTQEFYERHGGKTIIFAKYAPIVRTFAPFVAGIGRMRYSKFALFNFIGGVTWINVFLFAGHYFGNIPAVKRNFHFIIIAIIFISFMPVLIEFLKSQGVLKSRAHDQVNT